MKIFEAPVKDKITSDEQYRELKRHIIYILMSASFIPLILMGGFIYYRFSTTVKEKSLEYMTRAVEQHKSTIDLFLAERAANLKILAYTNTFAEIIQKERLEDAFRILQREYDAFKDLGVIDNEGNHRAYIGPYELLEKNYKDTIWFKEVMEKNIYISDVFLGFREIPHFVIAIKRMEKGTPWILRATIDTERFNAMVESIQIGRSGDAYLLNKEGIFQTQSRISGAIMEKASFRPGAVYSEIRLEIKREKGLDVIYATSWLKNTNWLLVVREDLNEVYADLRHTHYIAIPIFILGGFCIIFAIFFATKQFLIRIETIGQEKDLLNEQLLQSSKLASIGEISAGIAHEINNPLAIIGEEAGWMKDLMQKEPIKDSPNAREFKGSLEEIKTQAGRVRDITHKLLSFARKMEALTAEVDINNLIDDIISLVEREAKLSNVTFLRNYQPDIPYTWSDPSQIRQVFLNLITNAMDAITVKKKPGEITISTRLNGGKILIEFADTGIGIPDENLDRIFLPFFTTKPPGKGTGLGLSICYGIIKKLGGEVTVKSKVGEGT
ncbi:MAG: two-component sensor histidine kinase, partial [Nitrospira sp.]|nr:two-component sensor histidine kinase [Nitrospira sp.]